jgi:hypothetical protein
VGDKSPQPQTRNPPSSGRWWLSEAATLRKGQELGMQAQRGESMDEYRTRLRQAIAALKRGGQGKG